ncbi:hypothetical protein E0I61_09185 [Flavobacterium ranwuense]|uniref:NACHT domain-containing protein n=1 Tax=Flavobacterium ranwuense TaxID=2541725 RepID=A0ABY2DRD1_9FLAO|nr:hypothetical protein [Flavobacterium ranwuense]TDE29325.1 hypothetical protein E0I61_09185 [Flavobacterium ranwuense]
MKNAFYGYSFQKLVTSLMLTKMDVERSIESIEIEALVDHKFDDIRIISSDKEYFFQIKDFATISLNDVVVSGTGITIAGKLHKLSMATNVLFFNRIEITPDCEILGIPALRLGNIYIISQSGLEIDQRIEVLYKTDHLRKYIIDQFFSECLDKRKLLMKISDLPALNIFKTYLIEPTVNVTRKVLDVENILLIEGKPGVGKSHLVVNLEKQYKNNIIYRFWVSNHDNDYNERLKYNNFIQDFSKKLFWNLKPYTEAQVIGKLAELEKTVIIDGLDHVENYNPNELEAYVTFIDNLMEHCKVIVLSRPLQRILPWKKQLLGNWNHGQTKTVLNELYHIQDYNTIQKIFTITDGYPILVRYIAEQYRIEGSVPDFEAFDTIDKYYEKIIEGEKGKQALALFLCVRSYLMQSEIDLFLDAYGAMFVKEFVTEHPYLFELRLNRISMFHDSFITFLRKRNTDYKFILDKVNAVVFALIINGDKRFQSRFSYFDLSKEEKQSIIRKYASIIEFKKLMEGVIDFEAVRDFYFQIREALSTMVPEVLEIRQYYDLSLILNMVSRDHISTLNGFHYTYCRSLFFNGYSIEDITSTRYLFGMFYYLETNDGSLLLNTTSDDNYETSRFFSELQNDAREEIEFFEKHKKPLSVSKIRSLLNDSSNMRYKEIVTYVLEDLFIYTENRKTFKIWYSGISEYMKGNDWKAVTILEEVTYVLGIDQYALSYILKQAREYLLAIGMLPKKNEFLNMSLKQYIVNHRHDGSFTMWVDILSYMRLALQQERKIDLGSISLFWNKYYIRKDHSLYTLDTALPVFERLGYIEMFDSVCLINKIQIMSEKGYRGLLADYVMEHPPEFIASILEDFHSDNLNISWFLLEPEYINVLPDRIYNIELRNQIRYHRTNNNIPYDEVENLLDSNRLDKFREDLAFHRYSIWIKDKRPEIKKLKALKIPYNTFKEKDYVSSSTPVSYLEQGILDSSNKHLIIENGLNPSEVAAFGDGYYAALSDIEIYNIFSKEDLGANIQGMLFNAMTSRLRTIDHFHSLWPFPGNVIKLLYSNEVVDDFEEYFRSFITYLDLSMFDLKNTVGDPY